MVGAGAVLFCTPLHPIGHAIGLGGMAVLGTEFDAPRKATKTATKSIRKMTTKVSTSVRNAASSLVTRSSKDSSGDEGDELDRAINEWTQRSLQDHI